MRDDSSGSSIPKSEIARQAAYADDLTGSGKIDELKVWWDKVINLGPYIGYYTKPSKSWLIVKLEHLNNNNNNTNSLVS